MKQQLELEYTTPFLKAEQINEICNNLKYILLRYPNGSQFAFNCKVNSIAKKRNRYYPGKEMPFISYRECSFNEYISLKTPFC